ncbi:hypothetical protein ACM67C_11195 [Bergeriella denitrificans]|nr:hypothetical protein [Bergeriella denitrificans]
MWTSKPPTPARLYVKMLGLTKKPSEKSAFSDGFWLGKPVV